jgi:hypothetical protein
MPVAASPIDPMRFKRLSAEEGGWLGLSNGIEEAYTIVVGVIAISLTTGSVIACYRSPSKNRFM